MNVLRTKSIEQSLKDTDDPEYQLKKQLTALDLTVFGIGVVIGAGIFTLTGRVANQYAGPSVVFSFALEAICLAQNVEEARAMELVRTLETLVAEHDTGVGPAGARGARGFVSFFCHNEWKQALEHFSADGRPLRSSIQLALSTQEIQHAFGASPAARPPGVPSPGAAGIGSGFTASAGIGVGATVQGIADGAGLGGSWQQIAAANGIENPRVLAPGAVIDLGIGVG